MNPIVKNIPLCILLTFIVFGACQNDPQSYSNNRKSEPMDSLRYLALGDSYTIGESVSEKERWPVQLVESLRQRGFKIGAPHIIAKTGWTTDELQAGIKQAHPQGEYDLVSLMIGVNNQYRGRDAEEYRMQFRALLEQAVVFASGAADHVIVLSIPDWSVTPFAEGRDSRRIQAEIDVFNAVNKEETEQIGARYVDVTPFSRGARNDPALVAPDGLHPSGKMYAGWVQLVLPEAVTAIDEQAHRH